MAVVLCHGCKFSRSLVVARKTVEFKTSVQIMYVVLIHIWWCVLDSFICMCRQFTAQYVRSWPSSNI